MQVLISPESVEEALSLIDCNMDILDVKNTKEGSLGAQFPWNTMKIVEMTGPRGIRTSATLGDLPFKPGTASLAAYGVAKTGVGYIKAGLHGMNTYQEACEMMVAIRRAVRMVSDTAVVVASGYADWRRFGGLSTDDLVKAAHDTKCDLVMVDTAIKDGKNLFDNMTVQELKDFVRKARNAGMQVALAGSIKAEHADVLFDIDPDVIGVRGAVCEGKDRTSRISPEKTNRFVELFHQGAAVSQKVA
ncbi:MAG: (5-formylfuran-3-yl)methyl phosphate synthase [Planctomycetes bacterium]|nr:(5-formylfuran-3-yl)methyl phosphate synthase [Planctomycetota bacterium]